MKTDEPIDLILEQKGHPIKHMITRIPSDISKIEPKDKTSLVFNATLKLYSSLIKESKVRNKLTFWQKQYSDVNNYIDSLAVTTYEAIANAVEWGNKKDSEKDVKVTHYFFKDAIYVSVADQGKGFDYKTVIDGKVDAMLENMDVNIQTETSREQGGEGIKRLLLDLDSEFNYDQNGSELWLKYDLPFRYRLDKKDISNAEYKVK